jgi:hypothetical protein
MRGKALNMGRRAITLLRTKSSWDFAIAEPTIATDRMKLKLNEDATHGYFRLNTKKLSGNYISFNGESEGPFFSSSSLDPSFKHAESVCLLVLWRVNMSPVCW